MESRLLIILGKSSVVIHDLELSSSTLELDDSNHSITNNITIRITTKVNPD